jgi:hypothetical protein
MDLHERFDDWLADGADGEPPRDLALHASTCDDCMRAVAVVESLQAIQVGAAELPPLRFGGGRPRPFRVARLAIGALAAVLLGVSIAIGASGMFSPAPSAVGPTESPAERVLAGAPDDEATDRSPSPTPTRSASATPTPSPSATPTGSPDPTAAPAQTQAPRTPVPQPPPPTAAPPTPAPTAAPTVAPTSTPPTPSPSPSPTPVPDTDGDGFPDDVDECPLEPAGLTPDPLRLGCPLPLPPP